MTQYCEGAPVSALTCDSSDTFIQNPKGQLKGVWLDTTPMPNNIAEQDIWYAVQRADQHFGYDPDGVYFVFTPTGQNANGFGKQYCAYHANGIDAVGNDVAYAYIPYFPDAGWWCGENFINKTNDSYGHGYFDGFSFGEGHEYAEVVTDPHPFGPSSAGAVPGWEIPNSGTESGDNCAWAPTSGNITLKGNLYFPVQPLWSNESDSCVMSS